MRGLQVRLWHRRAACSDPNPLIRPQYFCASAQAGAFSRREKAMEPQLLNKKMDLAAGT